ncbi:MAG: hypothetical protein RLZZ591_1662 [Pseudomonadota bacterium]|jgi:predicted DNA-binding transcriptional regulator AlpA
MSRDIEELAREARSRMSRLRYELMWENVRRSDPYNDGAPSVCNITKELPPIVVGNDKPFAPPRQRSSAVKVKTSAQATSTTTCDGSTSASPDGEVATQDDDDGGGDDPDPDGRPPSKPASSPSSLLLSQSKTPLSTARLLRLAQVLEVFPVSKSTWWAGVRTGRYPRPVSLSPRTTAWRASDILKLIRSLDEQSFYDIDQGAA